MKTRIVATGAGVISPIAAGMYDFESALYRGEKPIGPSSLLETPYTVAEIPAFDAARWLGAKGIRVLDRTARLVCVAVHLALEDAGLKKNSHGEWESDVGLICGTMVGSVHSIASFDWSGLIESPQYVSPMEFPNTVINSPAGQAAIRFKLTGINSTICAGFASGISAIVYAASFLKLGRARTLLAGGAEEICEETVVGFHKSGAASPTGAARPFASGRNGSVPGEGAAFLVLETEADAREHGRNPLWEIAGAGSAHDGYPVKAGDANESGARTAIATALEKAGIESGQVACIVSGANGSEAMDQMEAHVLQQVFGSRLSGIPVCAPKAAMGEASGASGALNSVIAGIALQKQSLPPTPNYQENAYGLHMSAESLPVEGDYALVNAFGFDGIHSALVLKRCERT
jgi:3-oxoacyl-[acyl-carrier-protein] synthase II